MSSLKKFIKLIKSREFAKFFVVGISAFVLDFLLLQFFIKLFNIPESNNLEQTLANIGSVAISVSYNFFIQKVWAFKSKNRSVGEAGKFISVHFFNLVVYQTIFFSVVNFFLPSWLSKIIVTSVQIFSSFLLYKFFVFKKQDDVEIIKATIETSID